jgi:hypothetical protein
MFLTLFKEKGEKKMLEKEKKNPLITSTFFYCLKRPQKESERERELSK